MNRTRPKVKKPDLEFKPGKGFTKADWDAVDSPEATDEQIAQARPFVEVFPHLAESIRRGRGRPATGKAKQVVSIRLESEIVAKFKATGPGWHGRINEVLKRAKDTRHNK
jgi:uncharacterized protein (DUF4415 family)